MASELQLKWIETGITAYAIVYNATGQPWNGSAFEAYTDANIANYDVALSEAGTASQLYVGTMPAGAAALAQSVSYHKQAGGGPAVTDLLIGTEDYRLNAAALESIEDAVLDATGTDHNSINTIGYAINQAHMHAEAIEAAIGGGSICNGPIGATGNDTTHLHLPGVPYGDDELNDYLLVILDDSATTLRCARWIDDWDGTAELATISPALPFTPEDSVDLYWVIPVRRDGVKLGSAQTTNITGNITGNLSGSVGSVTGAVGSVTGAVGSVTGAVGSVTVVSDKTGYSLAATGLDSISTTAPAGVASNFREMLVQVWRRFFKRTTKDSDEIKTYADNGTSVLTTQTYTSAGDDDDVGAAS